MDYCLSTNYGLYSDYDGNYYSAGTYNGYSYYTGNGITTGYIYYNTGQTVWCLSSTLGGSCILFGGNRCNSLTPNLSEEFFKNNICLTPTPTPSQNCSVLDFNVFFDCDIVPPTPSVTQTMTPTVSAGYVYPTPTPTMTCTPTSSGDLCGNFNFCFVVQNVSPTPSPTPTITPSSAAPRNTNASGVVSFTTINDNLICPPVQII
jgi:hypothetical protein